MKALGVLLTYGAILALVTTACTPGQRSSSPNAPATSQPANPQVQGTDSSGGGNALEPRRVHLSELEPMLMTAWKLLPYVFYYLEGQLDESPDLRTKLFALDGTETRIQKEIQRSKFRLQKEACLGPEGYRQAAAYSDGTICVSSDLLQKAVNSENAFVKILALSAHEVSHLTGADEDEASEVQRVVEASAHPFLRAGVSSFRGLFESQIGYLKDGVEDAIGSLDGPNGLGMVCASLGALNPLITALRDTGFTGTRYGILLLPSPEFFYFYDGLGAKAAVATAQYCTENGSDLQVKTWQQFGASPEISVEEFLRRQVAGPEEEFTIRRHRPINDILIRQMNPGDRDILRQELVEILDLVSRLKAAVEVSL